MSDALIYLAEVTVYDPTLATEKTLYYSSGQGYVTEPDDTPANTVYEPRIEQPALLRLDCFSQGSTGGATQVGYGELVLVNTDGGLDELADYAFDGRTVVIKIGAPDAVYSAFQTVFRGVMVAPALEYRRVSLRLRDAQALLATDLQTTLYAGDNALPDGLEGTEDDLKDRPKPLCWGRVLNISPPCVNTSKLIYQIHDGALAALSAVYDNGVALTAEAVYPDEATLLSTAPSAGAYRAWLAGGTLRLGSPPAGTITADASEGATAADRTAAQLLKRVALLGGISSGSINSSDVTALDTANSAECGVWVPDQTTPLAVMDGIANSIGAWYGFDALGQLRMQRLEAPSGTPVAVLTEVEIKNLERRSLADGQNGLPAWKIDLGYARNHTVQDGDAVAGSVTPDRAAWLEQANRRAVAEDASIQTVHPLAEALTLDTVLLDATAAATEASRRLALYGVRRDRLEVEIYVEAETIATLILGAVVQVVYPRFGYNSGKLFRIIGLQPDYRRRSLLLTLWG